MTRSLAALVREQLQRLRGTFRPRRSDEDLVDELRAHLQLSADADGVSESAESTTRTAPLPDATTLLSAMEALRDQRSLSWLDDLLCDLRDAVYRLRRSPGFTALAVGTLGLGIGATTAVFSAFDAVALRPVPVHDPATLVRFRWVGSNDVTGAVNAYGYSAPTGGQPVEATFPYPIFQAFLTASHTLSDLAACAPAIQLAVVADGRAEMATGLLASPNYFELLGVRPEEGRTFRPTDDAAGAPTVAVISDAYWRRRFGGKSAVIGSTLAMSGVPVTIVGVTPARFPGIQRVPGTAPDVTVPLSAILRFDRGDVDRSSMLRETLYWWLELVGRMKPGVTPEQVRRDLAGIFRTSAREGWNPYVASFAARAGAPPPPPDGIRIPALRVASAGRGIDDVSPDRYQMVGLLAIVAAMVLLLACVNLENLLLARAAIRRREIWIRLSMGATAGRLLRQVLAESGLLALPAGGLGVLLALRASSVLPTGVGRFPPLDSRALLFAAATTAAAAIAVGVMPAVKLVRRDPTADVERRWSAGRANLAQVLVVAQVALSMVLLVGAGLFQRTVDRLQHVDVGFEASRLLLVNVSPPLNSYDRTRVLQLYTRLIDRLTRVPGVVRATLSRPAPLSGGVVTAPLVVDDRIPPLDGRSDLRDRRIRWMMVDPNFFDTWGIPIVAGRGFTSTDVANGPQVVIVNEAAARELFSGDSAIGHRMSHSPGVIGTGTIVGVVGDARYDSLRDTAPPTLYVPYAQEMARWGGPQAVTIELRTAGDPTAVAAAVREAARNIDPDVPVAVSTEREQMVLRSAREALFAGACTSAGILALLLASLGLFALISYRVVRQGREIGIRIALGAWRADVVRMVIGEALALVGIGIAVGLLCVATMGRFIASVLFDVEPTDTVSWLTAVAVMVVLAVAASYVPARRASRVDAMAQLRCE